MADSPNTDLAKFEHELRGIARVEAAGLDVVYETLEEKLEKSFSKQNLSHLLFREDGVGAIARFIATFPEDGRLIVLNSLAAAIVTSPHLNKYLSRLIATAIRALPRSLPDMFREKEQLGGTVDVIDAADVTTVLAADIHGRVEERQFYVGNLQTDLIHDQAVHPAADGQMVVRGNAVRIIDLFGDRQLPCPVCFKEWASGLVEIKVETKPPPAPPAPPAPSPKKATPLGNIGKIAGLSQRRFIIDLYRLAEQEMVGDTGAGLEGRAFKLANQLAACVGRDPGALADLVPNPVPDLSGPLRGDGTKIDEETETFISALFLAYGVEHPMNAAAVVVQDKLDGLWSFLPKEMQRERGWRGLDMWYNDAERWGFKWLVTRPLKGLLILLLGLAIAAVVTVIVLGLGTIIIALVGTIGGIAGGLGGIGLGIMSLIYTFWDYYTWAGLFMQLCFGAIWVGRFAAVQSDLPFKLADRLLNWSMPAAEYALRKAVEPIRRPALTISLATGVVGIFATLLMSHEGLIVNAPHIVIFNMAMWTILTLAEVANKFAIHISDKMRQNSVRVILIALQAVFVFLIFLGVTVVTFVQPVVLTQAGQLTNGVATQVIHRAAEVMDVQLDKTDHEIAAAKARVTACAPVVAKLMESTAKHEMSAEQFCAVPKFADSEPCVCLETLKVAAL